MLFTTVEELRACLSSVHQNNANSLLSYVATAETLHLAPVLGEGLVEQLGSLPAEAAPAHLLALRAKFRAPLAYYAVLAATLNDLGMTEGEAPNSPATRQWVYNNFVEAAAATADKLLAAGGTVG